MAKMNLSTFVQKEPLSKPQDHASQPAHASTTNQASMHNLENSNGSTYTEQVDDVQPERMHKTSLYIPMSHYKALERIATELSYSTDEQGKPRGKISVNKLILHAVSEYIKIPGCN